MNNILYGFLLATALAIVLNIFFKRFSIPTIIGYIVTGILISQFFDFKSNDEILHIAEFGIAFLMFTIGLEFSFKHLMTMKNEVFLNGALQVFVSGLLLGILVFYTLNIDENAALIAGAALALSSTAIVLKTLNDNGDITQIYGRKSLGILLFQDIAVIPILLMIDILSSNQSSINELLLKTFIGAVVLISVLYLIGRYIVNFLFYKVVQTNSQEIFIATVLFLVIGAGSLAHFFDFSYSLGAFLAGMMMAETQYKHQIEADLIPFRDLLLGLFFITVGMQIEFKIILQNIWLIAALVVGVMAFKAAVVFALIVVSQKRRVAAKTALSICQVGEFALAVFGLMSTRGLLDTQTAQIFIAVAVISMFVTPFILKNINRIADLIEQESIVIEGAQALKPQHIKDHVVVFGYSILGQEVTLRLKEKKIPYLVIESDINLVELGRERNENVFLGNATQKQTFENACIGSASAVIITFTNEQRMELTTQAIKAHSPQAQTIVRFSGENEKELFHDLGANFHLIKDEASVARMLVHEALQWKIEKATRRL